MHQDVSLMHQYVKLIWGVRFSALWDLIALLKQNELI
jgi:hypothetical protein